MTKAAELLQKNKRDYIKTICVDFDGVLSNTLYGGYDTNEFIFLPVTGAVEWINELVKYFEVLVFSARELSGQGQRNLYDWLNKYGFPGDILIWTNIKPPRAHYFVDDRANFDGTNFPTVQFLLDFTPWNRK